MGKILLILSISFMTTMAMADSWKKNPVEDLSGKTVGYYKRLKTSMDECKALVDDGAGLGLKDGKVLVDDGSWYGLEDKDGPVKLGCQKIHGKLSQIFLTMPVGNELENKLEIKE